jgi:CheY-like chemotaxis protein
VDQSNTRRHDGAGLGLAITAEVIRAMAGSRSLRSEPGRGSTFSFTIPLAIDAARIDDAPDGEPPSFAESSANHLLNQARRGPALRVLLAEDTRTNQILVTHALGKRGHAVEVASDGHAAVELAQKERFDVILMDLQMPGMGGIEATTAIRGLPGLDDVPIVALTAHSMVGDRERCLAAGMEGYLSKPIDLHQLVETVESAAARRPTPPRGRSIHRT